MTPQKPLSSLTELHQEANQLFNARQFSAAMSRLEEALRQYPDDTIETHKKMIGCCIRLGLNQEGYAHGHALLKLGVRDTLVLQGMAFLSQQLGKEAEALDWQTEMVDSHPTDARYKLYLAYALRDAGKLEKAWELFHAVELQHPEMTDAKYQRIFAGRRLCRWETWHDDVQWLRSCLSSEGKQLVNPYLAITYDEFSPAEILQFATQYTAPIVKPQFKQMGLHKTEQTSRKKMRIGFISADFFAHATTHLMIEFLEQRDTIHFETWLYSYKKNLPNDVLSARCRKACERFIDISELNDEDAARLIAADELDLLIDVKGFNVDARLGILSYRPANRILSWLAYPGTLGQPSLADYIIGDAIVTPETDSVFYSEKILNLPVCYQPNKRWRTIDCNTNRTAVGLPDNAVVFCSFNQIYKLTPRTFKQWCELIREVPQSVLWMLEPKENGARHYLLTYWVAAGLAAERLIFAPRVGLETHEKRIALADIGLDTFPYTSHTTARDLFAVGIPLVAITGQTFTSRVSASLLHHMGLQDLIAKNSDDWKKLNLKLARDCKFRNKTRERVLKAAQTSPLFNPQAFSNAFYKLCGDLLGRAITPYFPPTIIHEDAYIRVMHQPGDAQDVLFVFGDLVAQADRLNFPASSHLTRRQIPVIAVMPKGGNWYPHTSMLNAKPAIEKALLKNIKSRRFLYGGSMGGYAAIRYSRLLNAHSVLAMVPQSTIDRSAFGGPTGYDQYFVSGSGGQVIHETEIQGTVHIVYDPLHEPDRKHAEILQAITPCHAIQLRGTGHHATTMLVRSGLFGDVLDAFRACDNHKLRRVFKKTRLSAEWNASLSLQLLFFRKPEALMRLLEMNRRSHILKDTKLTGEKRQKPSSTLWCSLEDPHRTILSPLQRIARFSGGVNSDDLKRVRSIVSVDAHQHALNILSEVDPIEQMDALRTTHGLVLVLNPFSCCLALVRDIRKHNAHPVILSPIRHDTVALAVRMPDGNLTWVHLTQTNRVRLDSATRQCWQQSSMGERNKHNSFALVHRVMGPLRFDTSGAFAQGGQYVGFFCQSSIGVQ